MTQNIIIKNPSQKIIQAFDAMRTKKQQQIKKLAAMKQCAHTITI